MRPIGKQRSAVRYPLDEIFGSAAHVRLIRVLVHDVETPLSVADAARFSGLTPQEPARLWSGSRSPASSSASAVDVRRSGARRRARRSLKLFVSYSLRSSGDTRIWWHACKARRPCPRSARWRPTRTRRSA